VHRSSAAFDRKFTPSKEWAKDLSHCLFHQAAIAIAIPDQSLRFAFEEQHRQQIAIFALPLIRMKLREAD
jgi:hypothetical protein